MGDILISRRKLSCTKSSYTITIPPEWFKGNKLDPKKIKSLLILANEHVVIVNPKNRRFEALSEEMVNRNMTLEQVREILQKEVVF